MEELRQHIDALSRKLTEKETEIRFLKAELAVLSAKADQLFMEQQQKAREEQQNPAPADDEPFSIASSELPLPEQDESRAMEEQTAEQEEPAYTPAPEEQPAPQPEAGEIPPATHDAIMRTLERLSRDMSIPKNESQGQRFKSRPTLSDKVAMQRLKDLKGSLGINERFLYANELFNGDMGAFTRALEELNHLESEMDAERLLNEDLAEKYKWNEESEVVIAFKSLVSRRFA